jgi:hypothetical protein
MAQKNHQYGGINFCGEYRNRTGHLPENFRDALYR